MLHMPKNFFAIRRHGHTQTILPQRHALRPPHASTTDVRQMRPLFHATNPLTALRRNHFHISASAYPFLPGMGFVTACPHAMAKHTLPGKNLLDNDKIA